MKSLFALFLPVLFFLGGIPAAHAQLALNMECSQATYLQYEPVYITVTIENHSASMLTFGSARELAGKIEFDIYPSFQQRRKIALVDKSQGPQIKDLIIPAGASKKVVFKVSDYYNTSNPGTYAVRAKISHPLLAETYVSNESSFNITRGNTVWSHMVGIPEFSETALQEKDRKIQTRTYRLLSYNSGKVNVYSLMIEDAEKVYMLRKVGYDMGANLSPKCSIDFLSRLHMIIAASPHVFVYYQYDVDGKCISRDVLMKTETTPSLYTDPKTGTVSAIGGRESVPEDMDEILSLPFLTDYRRADSLKANLPEDEDDDEDDDF